MDLGPEQCLLFQPAIITASRGRINSMLGSGKPSNHRSNLLELSATQISIILRQGCPWIINSKVRGTHPWVAHKANLLSSLNSYGKTATNLSHLQVFQGLIPSLKVANQRH